MEGGGEGAWSCRKGRGGLRGEVRVKPLMPVASFMQNCYLVLRDFHSFVLRVTPIPGIVGRCRLLST